MHTETINVSLPAPEKSNENQLYAWLKRHFDAHGVTVGLETVKALVFRSGRSMDVLANEVEKLSALALSRGKDIVTPEDVNEVASSTPECDTYALSNAILDRSRQKAYFALEEMKLRRVDHTIIMGMIARKVKADINVIALVGERGREVREFIENDLGPEGMARSVVVVATSDQPAMMREKCPMTATAIAEYFMSQGKDVLIMMDNLTRFAMAKREVGLSVGEPPIARGYTPSIYSAMPKLLERAGCFEQGSITGIYAVLVEGDDTNEPIADTVRGIIDGHIVLSRKIAAQNHYPAIDVLGSVSRLMSLICTKEHKTAAGKLRRSWLFKFNT